MKIVIIEHEVYHCNEKLFKEIEEKKAEVEIMQIEKESDYCNKEMIMCNYLDSISHKMKFLGFVNFDFRL